MRKKEKNYANFLLVGTVLIIIFFSFTAKYYYTHSGSNFSNPERIIVTNKTQYIFVPTENESSCNEVTLYVPAVDNQGNGVATKLIVEAHPGKGRVLVDVNQLLFWVDTQYSIQTAKKVAESITNMNLSKVDLIYAIETNASLIEGPSAGAALTIATIAALENKSINHSVMITGTINPDGSIGPVGGIVAKAKAAKDVGAKLFLVPEGQATQTTYKPIQKCEHIGGWTICQTEYKEEKVNVMTQSGITVREVSNIGEALKYFILK